MKRFLFVTMVSLVFAACNGEKKPTQTENKDTVVKSMTAPIDEKEKKTEELKKAPQLTIEQMRILLPHELDSATEKNYLASTQFGYGIASAEYPKSKSRVIKITLYDCAGEKGAVNYFENYWDKLNVNSQTENDFIRTVDFEGGQAVETYKKDFNLSTFTFVIRDRLVIVMEGKNISSEELEEAAKKLHKKIA
ncbi:MAG TPA: hypothetical protein VL095_02215 [Flavisolibacter sp.]|nr:hypothetical protein [Flavisolibacter sp.]